MANKPHSEYFNYDCRDLTVEQIRLLLAEGYRKKDAEAIEAGIAIKWNAPAKWWVRAANHIPMNEVMAKLIAIANGEDDDHEDDEQAEGNE